MEKNEVTWPKSLLEEITSGLFHQSQVKLDYCLLPNSVASSRILVEIVSPNIQNN